MAKILVCGAGAVGIYLGTLLFQNNNHVELFGRRKLKEVQEKVQIDKRVFPAPARIFRLPKNKSYDFVFITTKLYDSKKIIKSVLIHKIKTNIVACVQNGLVDNSKYEKLLKQRIIPLSVFSGYQIEKDMLKTSPTPVGWKTENSKEGRQVSKLLFSSGVNCTSDPNYNSIRAEKAIVNCSLNALSAVEHKQLSKLFETEKTRNKIEKLFTEAYTILHEKYQLDKPEKIKQRLYKNWSGINHYSSTCQDIDSGRKTEINFLNGYLVKLGKELHIPTPENESITQAIKELEKRHK